MTGNSVFKLDNFYLVRSVIVFVEIASLGDCRIFDVKTIIENLKKIDDLQEIQQIM